MTEYWFDPKNCEALSEALPEYWSNPKSTEHSEKLSELMIAQWEAQPFNLKAKRHTQNRWRKSEQLLKPHQCAMCGTQYESINHAMLQNMENCNHTVVLLSSAQLILQELPDNSLTTVCQRGQ